MEYSEASIPLETLSKLKYQEMGTFTVTGEHVSHI